MNDKIHGDIAGHTLSEDSHDDLLAIRDMVFAMAKMICIFITDGEDSAFLSVRRSHMAEIFEHIGSQIDAAMATAKPTANVVEVAEHAH